MKRVWINYVIDVLLFATGAILAVSSLLVWVVFPKGYNPSWLLWIEIHKWSGLALVVEAFAHVVLHFGWLARMSKKLLCIGRSRLPR